MNRDQKAAVIDRVATRLEESEAVFAVDYRGLSVKQAVDLRASLREAEAEFAVVKNTLTERAADKAGIESLKALLEGPTALAFVRGDVALAAKALARFRRESGLLEWKGGHMGEQVLTPDELEALARLPAREQLHAQLVGVVASPLTTLVRGLGSMISGLAVALGQVRDQKAEGGEQEAEARAVEEAPAAEAEAPAEERPASEAEAPGDPVAEGEAAEQEETSETPSEGDETETQEG